ncbi:hypothetical protein KUCAC02_009942, partial [Chaenocephalus aceratus]
TCSVKVRDASEQRTLSSVHPSLNYRRSVLQQSGTTSLSAERALSLTGSPHLCMRSHVVLDQRECPDPQRGAGPGMCSGSALGILISSILKVAFTKERWSGATKATQQPYKVNGTLRDRIRASGAQHGRVYLYYLSSPESFQAPVPMVLPQRSADV